MAALLTAVPGASQTQTVTLVGAGDIAECSQDNNAKATAALLDKIPGTVLALGDNAYPNGTRTQYANCYDNYRLSDGSVYDATRTFWWGQYKDRTMPVVGNHEYHSSTVAQPYNRLLQRPQWLQAAPGTGAEHDQKPRIDTRQGLLLLR